MKWTTLENSFDQKVEELNNNSNMAVTGDLRRNHFSGKLIYAILAYMRVKSGAWYTRGEIMLL